MIVPEWPAPKNVKALVTTREGGGSKGCFKSFNLGQHVNDDAHSVEQNRQKLYTSLGLRCSWLEQVHGTKVVALSENSDCNITADGVTTLAEKVPCVVLTADCLPILLCNRSGTRVAALHAGWRGLAAGIVANGLRYFDDSPEDILVYLGPAISKAQFEVGGEVREAFLEAAQQRAFEGEVQTHFINRRKHGDSSRWLADLYGLAKAEFKGAGIEGVYGGAYCTMRDEKLFYSYRRDKVTGRFASLIYIEN